MSDSQVLETQALTGAIARRCLLDARDGDRAAFDRIVSHFADRLLRYLMAGGLGQADAEDLTQDTLIRAYQHLDRYDPRYAVSTWLFTIARRLRCNHFRDRKPGVPIEADRLPSPEEPTPGDDPLLDSVWQTARRVLPERQYEALWLHYGEDLDLPDIASVLDISRVNARVLVHRGRKRLARHLERQGDTRSYRQPAGVRP